MRWLLILVLWLSPLPALAQEAERGVLEALIEDQLSGAGNQVDITGFRGLLSSEATLEQLTIADRRGIWLRVNGARLNWTRSALLRGRLEVATLVADEITLVRLPDTGLDPARTEAAPFALPDLPVAVNIGTVSAQKLSLGPEVLGVSAQFRLNGRAQLDTGNADIELVLERLDAAGRLALAAGFLGADRSARIDLDLSEPQGGLLVSFLGVPETPSIALRLEGAGPLSDFRVDLALSSDDVPRLDGAFVLKESPTGAQRFQADLKGDIATLVAPELRPALGSDLMLEFSGQRLVDGAFEIDELAFQAEMVTFSGRMQLAADGLPQRFDLRGEITDGGRLVALPLPGAYRQLAQADLWARFDAEISDQWQAELRLRDFHQPGLTIGTAVVAATGRIGRVPLPQLQTALSLRIADLRPEDPALAKLLGGQITGTARLEWQQGAPLKMSALHVRTAAFGLQGAADLGALARGGPVTVALQLEAADLSQFSDLAGRGLQGAAHLDLRGRGTLLSGQFDLTLAGTTRDLALSQPHLDRLLAGDANLQLRVVRGLFGTVVPELSFTGPHARLGLAGSLNRGAGGAVLSVNVPELARLDPALAGPAELGATLGWQRATGLALHRFNLQGAGLRARAQGRYGGEQQGRPLSGQLDLSVDDLHPFSGLMDRALGGALGLDLSGRVELATGGSGDLALNAHSRDLRLGLGQADGLLRGETQLAARLSRREGIAEIQSLNLRNPQIFARISGLAQALNLALRLEDGALVLPGLSGAFTLEGTARRAGPDWQLRAGYQGPAGLQGQVSGAVAATGSTMDLNVQGQAPLGLINPFIAPRLAQGQTTYVLRLRGTPSLAGLSGGVTIAQGQVALPEAPFGLRNVQGRIELADSRAQLDLRGAATTGGRFRLRGPLRIEVPYESDLQIALEQLVVRDPTLYQTRVSGGIRIAGPLAGAGRISGRLSLGSTELQLPEGRAGSAAQIPAITHVGATPAVQRTRKYAGLRDQTGPAGAGGAAFGLDLDIEAPNRIFLRGRGLDAELGGMLRLAGTTADIRPLGQFQLIRGRLDILGKRLDLTEGRIGLQGVAAPYLRLVAENRSGDVLVRIVVEGPAAAPQVSFQSEPDLPEDEILAHLLFGREASTLSPLQLARLVPALATLSDGGEGAIGGLRGAAGLDDLDVSSTDDGETQLRLGKYLSDNAYSDVTVNSRGESEINLNLDISPNVTLKGTVGSDGRSGIGIFLERDY